MTNQFKRLNIKDTYIFINKTNLIAIEVIGRNAEIGILINDTVFYPVKKINPFQKYENKITEERNAWAQAIKILRDFMKD